MTRLLLASGGLALVPPVQRSAWFGSGLSRLPGVSLYSVFQHRAVSEGTGLLASHTQLPVARPIAAVASGSYIPQRESFSPI